MISAKGRRAGLKSPFSWNHDGYERTGGKGCNLSGKHFQYRAIIFGGADGESNRRTVFKN
jgi:hypothetical protein